MEARERGSVESLAAELVAGGCTILVAAGGDGTIGAVAGVAAVRGATLGVLPCGTMNHFAKDLRIPLDLAGAVNVIRSGRPVCIDAGEVNGHLFINNSSLGIYPLFVRERRRQVASRRVSRLVSVVKAAGRIARQMPALHVRLTTGEGTFVRARLRSFSSATTSTELKACGWARGPLSTADSFRFAYRRWSMPADWYTCSSGRSPGACGSTGSSRC